MIRAASRCSALVAIAGASAMVLVLVPAVLHGDFRGEGGLLLGLPWGRATLVDVYVGLVLFCGWVLRRESSGRVAAFWVAAILATGNLATCCYVLRAAATSGNDPATFWMGVKREA